MEYLNQILSDCLWGTCSSSIRHPRVAQCTRKLAQVTTLMTCTCILYVPGSNFGRDADRVNRKLLRFCPFLPDVLSCRHDWVPFPSSTVFITFHYSLSSSHSTSYVKLRLNSQVFRGATQRRWPSGSYCETKNTFFLPQSTQLYWKTSLFYL